MGDALGPDQLPDAIRVGLAQTDVLPSDGGYSPSGAPAVAVKHGQRPQVDRFRRVLGVDDLGKGVEVGPAVGIHDSLGSAGGSRGVVDRDRALLVIDIPGEGLLGAAGCEVIPCGCPGFGGDTGIVDGDHLGDRLQLGDNRGEGLQQFGVGEEQLGAGVVADVADLLRGEPSVDGDEHSAGQRYREVRQQHLGDVGTEERHPLARLDTGRLQGTGELGRCPGHVCRRWGRSSRVGGWISHVRPGQ